MAATVIEKYTWNVNVTKGGSPVSGVVVVGFNDADAKIIDTTTNASGVLASDLEVEAASHSVTGSTTTTTDRNPYDIRFLNYGDRFIQFGKTFSQRSIDSGFLETDTVITQTNKTTVNGYTGITFNHGSNQLSLSGGTWDEERLYDRTQAEAVDNPQADVLASLSSTDGINFTQPYAIDVLNIIFDSNDSSYDGNWGINTNGEVTDISILNTLTVFDATTTTLTDILAFNLNLTTIGTYTFDNVVGTVLFNTSSAAEVDSYALTNNLGSIQLGAAYDERSGQTFTATAGILTRLRIETSKTGSPPGNMVAKLYATSGGVPTGSPLATSQPIAAADAGIGATAQDFEFFDEFTLVASTVYWIGVEYTGGDAPNFIRVWHDATAPTHPGTAYSFDGAAWNAETFDHGFEVISGGLITVNYLNGSNFPSVQNTGIPKYGVTQILNLVTWTTTGVTEGTSVKVLAGESVGTVLENDVLDEQFADSNGEASFNINYESAFDPSGLDIIVRARNQGIAAAAISITTGGTVDETLNANSVTTDDMTLTQDPAQIADLYYFGAAEKFGKLKLDVSNIFAASSKSWRWEYWNGSSWQLLSNPSIRKPNGDISTSTADTYADLGESIYSWDIPGDWATRTENVDQGPFFYMRIHLFNVGSPTSAAKGRMVQLDTTRYLPFVQNNVLTSQGGNTIADWREDTISNPFKT